MLAKMTSKNQITLQVPWSRNFRPPNTLRWSFAFRAIGIAAHDGDWVFFHQQGLQRTSICFGRVDAKAA